MTTWKTAAFVGLSALATLSMAAVGQSGPAQSPAAATLVLDSHDQLATIDWIEKSDVAALREGVIEKMELRLGDAVQEGAVIGTLHKEIAELTVAKSKLTAENEGPILKADAAKEVAASVVARNRRLVARKADMVSQEEMTKSEGEFKVAMAQLKEAQEQDAINEAELALAVQMLKEHTIAAPFPGIVIKRYKEPGESVRANEAVVQIGNLARLSATAFVPIDYAFRVKVGQVVELQARLEGSRGDQPIERKVFRGVIKFVDPQVQAIAESAVRVRAEFENPNLELRPGVKAALTIFLSDDVAARPSPTAR
ncbi:efflux RND transporter periplasmic adaptor subunit [Paludisphaera mucosa]|uniref:Efflux RND transporter periplasmic adaptor subunit n=1 Tax=Paludisphaera mucosa TaxID=3030827 RepID=A0ABT6F5Q9_9BACT|nr:efflux RND transporter periplasmic adaptor subunit [Paludisphaera mucosa]MDG3002749.1 efflux RND transporter periplasmic adaptor subunit [Paludisphaera mucosa]